MKSKMKEGNVLFNDSLNTFYLRLYGIRHTVKDHSDSERGNPLLSHGLLFPINSKGSFICVIPQKDNTYHGLCYTSRGALAGTGKKEGNVFFMDALNTFYLWLYGVRHMVKDHSDSERGNPLPPHGLLFPISSKGSFICIIPQTG